MMKKTAFLLLCCMTGGLFADGDNLLKNDQWKFFHNKISTKINPENGIISCSNSSDKIASGAVQTAAVNQTEPRTLFFSAESRSENAVGTAPNNYCIYLDITHSDNTKTYAVMVPFKTGTNDWTKAEKTYTPKKSVKEVKFYLLFRKMTGKAEFRNAVLKQTEQ